MRIRGILLLSGLTFSIGLWLGTTLSRKDAASPHHAPGPLTPPAGESRSSAAANEPPPSPASEPIREPPSGATEVALLAKLHQLNPSWITADIVTRHDCIDGGFAKFLELTETQTTTLNQALIQAREKINRLSAENAVIDIRPDGLPTVVIEPLPAGTLLYDELLESFAHVLGREKQDTLIKLLGDKLSERYNHFGAEKRTLTVTREIPGHGQTRENGFFLKDHRSTSKGAYTEMMYVFFPDRLHYMPPAVEWVGPLVAPFLKPAPNVAK